MGNIHIEGNQVIDCAGGIVKVVGNLEHTDLNIKNNLLLRHTGYLVDFFEKGEPNFLAQWGFPPDTNPEQVAELLVALQGKDQREAKELLALGTYANLAQISSFIFQVAADSRVQKFLSSL